MDTKKVEEVRKTGCTLIAFKDGKYERAASEDFKTEADIVILIHGFTSHGEYMGQELVPYLYSENYQIFLFNYDSYKGILSAVRSLQELLETYDNLTNQKIRSKKIFLIGHSMGGLVARQFTIDDAKKDNSDRFIKGVIMLATPNNGVLQNKLSNENWRNFVKYLISVSEEIGGVFPQARTLECVAVKELAKIDEYNIIDKLNYEWEKMSCNLPPSLSISGGQNYLEFTNKLIEGIINRGIQQLISDSNTRCPNDGIVLECSVDMNSCISYPQQNQQYIHLNNYHEYSNTNHNTIHIQQIVSIKIVEWLQTISKKNTSLLNNA
ncbi:esterase/lipase family protein [Anabaena sp. CA = ATCC 33047]|uniref:esterase/lipase family protein n=1 Tax=Anabaena sp. (strain CA / ATCC 33047) TaxID=52271 RepID=UPI000830414D|nr:alpha/beta fold hydrolase [Anabaena sp. CA = ATCC 33047]